jgi:hypothetical protein
MPAKATLIDSAGQPSFGLFPGGVRIINYLDYDLRSPMDRKLGAWAKKFKFNQFEFIGLLSAELIVGIAIVNLKLVSKAFVYLYAPATGEYEEFSFTQLLARRTEIGLRPNDSAAVFKQGRNRLEIIAASAGAQRRVLVSLAAGLKIDAVIDESQNNALALCSRAGYQGWVFTQKAAAMSCAGELSWAGRHYDLAAMNTLASVDWTAGFMRKETFWNWASLSSFLADGRRLGMNLAAGVNETGFSENALWLDGRMIKVDMVDFQFQRYGPGGEWRMNSNDGIVRLKFQTHGRREEKLNAILMASNFTQHFGVFSGEICLPEETIVVENAWGFAEDHYARW